MRLIDADKLIKDIKELWDYKTVDDITATTVLKQTITDIENQPTVEAIPSYKDIFDEPMRFAMVSGYAIENAPTVKAIPIEWILKWACEFIDPNSEGYKMAMELVHDWRKENEHKESD